MLFNVVGIDGCGKSTQIDLLRPWVEQQFGLPTRLIRKADIFDADTFPDADRFFGCSYRELMYEILPNMKGESRAMFLFYMLATSVCNRPIGEREVAIIDGGWIKHVATEAAMGVDPEWLAQATAFFPRPDFTVMLDIDPETVVQRRKDGGYGPHAPYECGCRIDVKDADFIAQMNATAQYLHQFAQTEGWVVIDARKSARRVFEQMTAALQSRLAAVAASHS